jgi:hypothetical protein
VRRHRFGRRSNRVRAVPPPVRTRYVRAVRRRGLARTTGVGRRCREHAARGRGPRKPGLYAWWAGGNALPELVGTSHPHVAGLELLYVGICPDGVAGMRTIRDRLLRDHIRRTHRSTLRRALAAFLYVREGWTPGLTRGGRPALVAASETKLTAWMCENLQVSWAVCPRPRDIEAAVIRRLRPPRNSNHNAAHPAHEIVRVRREAWTAATRRALR